MERITFVLTSCGRPDLLQQTIDSFFRHNDYPIEKYIIIEDSADERMKDWLLEKHGSVFEVIFNKPKLGQIRSIDKAYSRVQTPYIFHCEDDWLFFRGNFISDSLSVLREDPKILQVWLRDLWDTNKHPPERTIRRTEQGVLHRRVTLDYLGWHGFSFNPGLRRKTDYDLVGSYEAIRNQYVNIDHEMAIGQKYKDLGYYATILEEAAVEHIGWDRQIPKTSTFKRTLQACSPPILSTLYRFVKKHLRRRSAGARPA
ncbi:MAG TPA: glycosyltransferase [Candidatus Polarisedimenticolia bacterium]|jgi:hypothetical protein